MKIFFNRPVKEEAWGGGSHFITSLYRYLTLQGVEVTFDLENNIDLIMMFDPRQTSDGLGIDRLYSYKKKNRTPIVQRINDTDFARHAYGLSPHDKPWRTKTFLYANQFVDHTVFISNWVKDHYKTLGYLPGNRSYTVIINGCNTDFFYPNKNKKDSDKLKLITHHWSDNPMKGQDVYIAIDQLCELDKSISFTYIGRYPKGYTPKNTTLIPPKYGSEIGDMLRAHDIYVTGARFEACGMHHIEAAACGLPIIYHKDGGAIPEICRNYGKEFSAIDELRKQIDYFKNQNNLNVHRKKINYSVLDNSLCCERYLNVFRKLL